MKKTAFEKFINLSIDKGKKEKVIYDNGLDLINFLDDYTAINNILINSIYGELVADMISEFITDGIYDELEKNKGNYVIYNKDGEILADCSTLDSLYDYCEKIRKELISKNYSYDIKPPMSEKERMKILKEMFK